MHAIYIHIPFCRSRCHYCAFTSGCDYSHVDSYIDVLCDNMVTDDTVIDSIFFGGGTPSTLTPGQFDRIFGSLRAHHNISDSAEITVECNPDSITHELINCLVSHGVNRISIGLQSVNDSTLSTIGRRHTYSDFLSALNVVKRGGIDNINVDIMIGLPEEYDMFINTVNTVARLDIAHISMYALELYPDSKLYNMVSSGECVPVADGDAQSQWYDDGMAILLQHGFGRYEISNFAKVNRQCRHNMHYWQCDQYFGYGLSAHGYIAGIRYANTDVMCEYLSGNILDSSTNIDTSESMLEYMMLGLRCDSGVSISRFGELFGVDMFDKYPKIDKLVAGGQLCIEGDMLYVNNNFSYVLTAILAEIL